MTSPLRCAWKACPEPRVHGTEYCTAHWSLVPGKLKTSFQFVLGRLMRNVGTPREAATAQDFKAVQANVAEAIREALNERGGV